jgi:hypothetical protein
VAATLALEPSVAQVNAANVKAGFLLPADGEASTGNAAESTVGRKWRATGGRRERSD